MKAEKEALVQQLQKTFPSLNTADFAERVSENLISPFNVKLSQNVFNQAKDVIKDFFNLRESSEYLSHYSDLIKEKGLIDPGNKSIMMSYDFHVDENDQLKLIEVNTNAAFLVLSHQMYQSKNLPLPVAEFSLKDFGAMVLEELKLQNKSIEKPKIVITDENPTEQRMYLEFLVYQELFKSFGWDCQILDFREIFDNSSPDFIYNRHTDFFLAQPESQVLRKKFLSKEVCISPNPFEYLLLADKQRMMDWRAPGFLEKMNLTEDSKKRILQVTPGALDLTSENAEEVWAQKKKYFVKPKNAFGSKQSYRAGSMSRKLFESLIDQQMIAQEFIPPSEQEFQTPEGPQKLKYDLRCYAYQGRMQTIVARLYQGQVTNLKTPYGGFAAVTTED